MKLIPLSKTGKKNAGKYSAMVDDDDYDWLNKYNWSVSNCDGWLYASARVNKKSTQMHRLIMGVTDPKIKTDHKDHDGFNCQRYNLRIATNSQNGANRTAKGKSKYLGVFATCKSNKWRAQIRTNGRFIHLGVFLLEEDAAKAYDKEAIKRHGEFANLNFK